MRTFWSSPLDPTPEATSLDTKAAFEVIREAEIEQDRRILEGVEKRLYAVAFHRDYEIPQIKRCVRRHERSRQIPGQISNGFVKSLPTFF
jgi:hypothetical protein